jgi:hypothetical protein
MRGTTLPYNDPIGMKNVLERGAFAQEFGIMANVGAEFVPKTSRGSNGYGAFNDIGRVDSSIVEEVDDFVNNLFGSTDKRQIGMNCEFCFLKGWIIDEHVVTEVFEEMYLGFTYNAVSDDVDGERRFLDRVHFNHFSL